jgi:hypothetical protein
VFLVIVGGLSVKVANRYKEAAWKLALDAFPTGLLERLSRLLPVVHPVAFVSALLVSHHFWACPVAVVVRTTPLDKNQLIACGVHAACWFSSVCC